MKLSFCPACDVLVSRREVGEGWCDSCGKKLPWGLAERLQSSLFQQPRSEVMPPSNAIAPDYWRLWGLLSLLLGSLLGYWSIYCPLISARHGEKAVDFSEQGVVVSTIAVLWGLVLSLFGNRAGTLLYISRRQLTRVGWLFAVALIGIGLLVAHGFQQVLESYGYRF